MHSYMTCQWPGHGDPVLCLHGMMIINSTAVESRLSVNLMTLSSTGQHGHALCAADVNQIWQVLPSILHKGCFGLVQGDRSQRRCHFAPEVKAILTANESDGKSCYGSVAAKMSRLKRRSLLRLEFQAALARSLQA